MNNLTVYGRWQVHETFKGVWLFTGARIAGFDMVIHGG